MKKKTLKLAELSVQSFVTSLERNEANTVKGGDPTNGAACNSAGCSAVVICVSNDVSNCVCPETYGGC